MMSYCFMVKKEPTHSKDKYLLILSKNDSGNTVKNRSLPPLPRPPRKALETGTILLIDQMAVLIFMK